MLEFCGSPLWDSNKTWHTDNPFFAPCFELTILVWVPCLLLFVFTPLDIFYIKSSKYANIPWGFINVVRLAIPTLLICLCIVDLSMAAVHRDEFHLQNVYMVSPAIKLVTFVLAMILAYLHKKSGIVSSGLLFLFWFMLFVFAIPQYRSEIVHFQQRSHTFGNFKYLKRFISLRVRAKLTLKENGESGLTLYKDYHQVYLFLIDVMKAGYRSCKKTITNDDAHAALRIVWGRSKQLFNDECQRVK